MKEETEFKPKPMIEIGDRPILWHIMKIYSSFGFNDNGDLIYLHLGRGTQKFRDLFSQEKRMSKKDWIRNVRTHCL